jgi:hypothetical protein
LSDGISASQRGSSAPPHRIVITLGSHFFAKVGKDDEPISILHAKRASPLIEAILSNPKPTTVSGSHHSRTGLGGIRGRCRFAEHCHLGETHCFQLIAH